jgi:hypothetical protein
MVINFTADMECKSQKIGVMVAAADKYLDLRDFTQGVLKGIVLFFQAFGLM